METADLSLTKQEENLMNFLWDYGQPATSHDVMEKCSNITWSVNYIHVMFRSLLKKGAIECCGMVQYGSQYARQFRCVVTREEYFSQQAKKNGMNVLTKVLQEACREKTERDRRRGILNRPVRAMVVGIPNVGKSTFINTYAGKACAKTGNKPGVTKGKQWIRLNKSVELLDTPGILWPKFEDQAVGMRLAMIGSIRDEILNTEELALELVGFLTAHYPGVLMQRYECAEEKLPVEILGEIAGNRGCIRKGSELDYEKASAMILDDFRSGKLGRITLEKPA